MSEGFNRVMLLGNLGADPDLRFTQAGLGVLNLRMAMTESYLDKDKVRRERTEWATVVVFGKRGESLAKILGKGSSIFVEGSLRTSSYDDKDGNKRWKTEVVANNVVLAGSRGRGGEGGGDGAEQSQSRGGGNGGDSRGGWTPAGGEGRGGGYGGGGGGGQQRAQPPQAPQQTPQQGTYPPADDFGYDDGGDIPF